MDRRDFLIGTGAATLFGGMTSRLLAAKPFSSKRISVRVYGSGPDVLLLPGLNAGRGVWTAAVRATPGYRYHLVQVAGFAGEPAGANASGQVVMPVMQEVRRYIESGLKRPAFVGHSMGGTIGMLIAARYPALLGRLMVVDMLPAPSALIGGDARMMRPLADGLRDLIGMSPEGKRLFGSFFGAGGKTGSDADVVARAMHDLAVLDITPELKRIALPCTIVHALPPEQSGRDPGQVAAIYRRAYAPVKQVRFVAIADSGHMIMRDQPARFNAAFKRFLGA